MPSAAQVGSDWGIVGNAHQVERLQRLVSRDALPGALLITGTPGIGRKAVALAMAKSTLCETSPAGHPCGKCRSCILIEAGSHPDVQVWSVQRQDKELIESQSGALRISTIKAIDSSSSLRPQLGSRRFVLIDDAETLEKDQQSAMLKMLEDAPPFLTIVLISTTSSAMIDTVLSRCIEIAMQLVPSDLIRPHISGPDADEIVSYAAGRPGWAIAAAADESVLSHERESTAALEAWIALSRHERLIEAYRRGDRSHNQDRDISRRERRNLLLDLDRLQRIWRDQVLTASNVPAAVFDPQTCARIGANLPVDIAAAHRALRATVTCHDDILSNVRPRLALQTMVNQWPTR